MKTEDPTLLRRNLIEDGYCVADDILDPAMLDRLRQAVRDSLATRELSKDDNFGSLIHCEYEHPVFADLIAWPQSLQLLEAMGFTDVRWMSFFLINKPPRSKALWWHQDWFLWDDPVSAQPAPTQVFLSYYLEDTSEDFGCLRVIPGTHRRRHELHGRLLNHGEVGNSLPPDHWMLDDVPDAENVPVKAGSLAIADSRLLHGARANQTDNHRPLLLGWYLLNFCHLSPQMRQTYSLSFGKHDFAPPKWWKDDAGEKVKPLVVDPPTEGEALTSNRQPGKFLS